MEHYNKEDLRWLLSHKNVNFDVLVDSGEDYQWQPMTEGVLMYHRKGGFPVIDHKKQGNEDGVNKLGYLTKHYLNSKNINTVI